MCRVFGLLSSCFFCLDQHSFAYSGHTLSSTLFKMAALAGDLSRKILGHSDAAKAFRPWWDTIEDNLLYAFVVIGNIQEEL